MPAPALSRTLAAKGAPRSGLAAVCFTQTTVTAAVIAAVASGRTQEFRFHVR